MVGGMADHVDEVLAQWTRERPDLDVSPMAVLGRLSRLIRVIEARQRATFARHGLDAASFDVLATLRRAGSPYALTPGQLARSAMVTTGAITQRLDRLQDRGLVCRSPGPTDARSVLVTLSDTGHGVIDAALPDHLDTEDQLLVPLDAEQRIRLAELLSVLLLPHEQPSR